MRLQIIACLLRSCCFQRAAEILLIVKCFLLRDRMRKWTDDGKEGENGTGELLSLSRERRSRVGNNTMRRSTDGAMAEPRHRLYASLSIRSRSECKDDDPPQSFVSQNVPCVNLAIYSFCIVVFVLRIASPSAAASSLADSFVDFSSSDYSDLTPNGVRREGIDTTLRRYAFMALSHIRTGVIYNVSLPPFLSGISCQAMRVRAGSTRRRGLVFNEFAVPKGVIVVSGGPFVILVYRKIYNFTVYSPPEGYDFVSPVVGIVVYTLMNTSFDDVPLPQMNIVSRETPISIRPALTQPIGRNMPLCAFFDINGSVSFFNVSSAPNVCSSTSLMDVALVLPSSSTPATSVSPSSPPTSLLRPVLNAKTSNGWKIAIVAAVGGLVGLVLIGLAVLLGMRVSGKYKMERMEEPPDSQETLHTSLIGGTRAPTAAVVRTRPSLETGSLNA